MSWRRLGHIFAPDGHLPWMRTHAANPFAVPLDDEHVRIYFSTRDEENRSSVGWLDYSMRVRTIRQVSERPAIGPGERGTFDDSGISVGWIVRDGSRLLLYYTGWNLGVTMPFRNSIGLATSIDGETFERIARAPVLDRSEHDPFSLSYPCVLRRGPSEWWMWYGSNTDWQPEHHVIKFAASVDGIEWEPNGRTCIGEEGLAFSRPSVLAEGGGFRMWYAFRGEDYRIGCARSTDGLSWTREDDAYGLAPASEEWASRACAYPHVFRFHDAHYMLYCGNGYGRTGFGIARLVDQE